jgi:Icc-related predicted phosphoesterase
MGRDFTRLFFITDIHGSDVCFRKFLNAAKVYDANVLILGGDITGKAIIPIIEKDGPMYTCNLFGNNLVMNSKEELDLTIKMIRDAGFYPFMGSEQEVRAMDADREKLDFTFEKLMVESIDSWMKLAYERLKGTGVKCFISPGNDDILAIDEHLRDDGEVVFNPEQKVVNIDDKHEMITLGYTNHTPWKSAREVDEEKLLAMIEAMCSQVKDMKNCLFNIHVPPIRTLLDQAPALDSDFKPITKGGEVQMIPAGSVATRQVIERYQPLAGIHGHIHESKGIMKIGRTTCYNPGSDYNEGVLKGLVLNLGDGKIKSYNFTSG